MKLTYLVNNSTLKIIWLLAIFFYSILASYCVMHYDGFYGLRVLSIGSITMMLLLILLFVSLHYDFGTKPQVDWSNYRKDKMKLFLIAFLLVPIMVFDLSEKLSILFFYNIDKSYKSAEIYNVQINGFFNSGRGGRRDTWAYATEVNDKYKDFVLICNLIDVNECSFGRFKGEYAQIKISKESLYPLKSHSLVYGFKSKNVNVESDELIRLYKENKKYIFYFLFFIYIPSIIFTLIISRVFNRKQVYNY